MRKVIVCVHARANPDQPSCAGRGGVQIADALELALRERNLPLELERFECLGSCSQGPNVKFVPDGKFLHRVRPQHLGPLLRAMEQFARAGEQ